MRIDRYLSQGETSRFNYPVLALGFRVFFLLASGFAALWLVLWMYIYLGEAGPALAVDPTSWHAHEMVFGFATAVLAGFLLTAVRNWTKRPTATGGWLASLALLWVAGRVAMVIGGHWPLALVAVIDGAFLPVLALAIARPIWESSNRRNAMVPVLLLVLAGLNIGFFAAPMLRREFTLASVYIVVVFLVFMGGRVIPMFTRNAVPQSRVVQRPWLDWATLVATLLYPVSLVVGFGAPWVALVAGVANLARWLGWDPWATRRVPLLWVLHVGYAWIGVGFLLAGLAQWSPALSGTAPLHALSVGALGTLTLGMMARVSRGHTGRTLASDGWATLSFALMVLATLTRVVLPLAVRSAYPVALAVAGGLWSVAFAIYFVGHWRMLTRVRVDGAPG